MKKIYLFSLLIYLFALSVYASPSQFIKQGKAGVISLGCENECNSSTTCNISIYYPNGSLMVSNQRMTNLGSYHNYTLSDTSTVGEYKSYADCKTGLSTGNAAFTFRINAFGEDSSGIATVLYVLIGVLVFTIMLVVFFYAIGNSWMAEVFLILSFVTATLIGYFGYMLSMDYGSAFSNVLYGVYFLFLIFTIFVVLLVLINWTLAIVGWVMGKNKKIEDNLI